jgi:hypothetical protein
MQHRALDPNAIVPVTETPLSVIAEIYIRYCPWCGSDLEKKYKKAYQELDRSELKISE